MKYQINIGLDIPGQTMDNYTTVQQANKALGLLVRLFNAQDIRLQQSNTELTMVAQFQSEAADFERLVYNLSDTLQQDCIAVLNTETNEGKLIGHKAAEWGAFNPEYFINY